MATLGQYNLDEMTLQEVFEASAIHLLEQSKKSIKGDVCLYNGDNICCAAGIFIQNYVPQMENMNWHSLVEKYNQSSNHEWVVTCLQKIHDTHMICNYKSELIQLGIDYKLDTTFLEKYDFDGQKYQKDQLTQN